MKINRGILKQMMEEKGLKISDLARQTGLSYEGIWSILKKEGQNVTITSLEKLAKAFRMSYEELTELLEIKCNLTLLAETDKDRKIQELERELKLAKRKLQPKTEKVNLLLKRYQLDTLKELAEEREESLNNYVCTLIDELVERVEEKREEIK